MKHLKRGYDDKALQFIQFGSTGTIVTSGVLEKYRQRFILKFCLPEE